MTPSSQALLRRAMDLAARKDFAGAVAMLGTLLEHDGANSSLWFNRAIMLQQLGRHREAIRDYETALKLNPADAEAWFNRAVSCEALGQTGEAIANYTSALASAPTHVPALTNRGAVHAAGGDHRAALADFEAALGIDPCDVRALYNGANALRALDRLGDAVSFYERALALAPGHGDAWTNRGLALETLGRGAEAIASFDEAIARGGASPVRHLNRANALCAIGRTEEALNAYDAALAIAPDHGDVRFAKACALLALGRYEEGWRLYETRWRSSDPPRFPNLSSPRWTGADDIAGKTLLLHGEQGFGDTLQFCRYAPVLAARGARVLMRVQPALKALLQDGLAGPARVFGYDDPPPAADFHCPLLSAPLACGATLDTVPAHTPYLRADPARVESWRARAPTGALARIGIAWRGDLSTAQRRRRVIALDQFAALFGARARFVSLQINVSEEESAVLTAHGALHFGDELRDFREQAALVAACDLVLSIDTGVAHLAGALGRPLFVLLPYWSDWRWMIAREDSPWYPTARLFRQRAPGDWPELISRVRAALAAYT